MRVVYEGKTKNGNEIIVREPQQGDAPIMTDYINKLSLEKTFISFQGEQLTVEDEQKFLDSLIPKIGNQTALMLLVFCGERLIGICDIELKVRAEGHVGILGISVAKEFRGEGIGRLLMDLIIKEANNLPNLKIITLNVYEPNDLAISLYEKFGFKEFGKLPGGIHYRDSYIDEIMMYRKVGDIDE